MTDETNSHPFGPYTLCGWKVYSGYALPELPPWNSSAPERNSLAIEAGDIPTTSSPDGLTITACGDIILHIPNLCGFYVSAAGDRVTIQTEAQADMIAVRNYLYGSVLAILCYLHGLFPLHGASVSFGGAAIAFTGHSGAGKSTLAMALALRGHAVLSDDVCAIEPRKHDLPLLHPSILRVKLLQDSVENFHLGRAAVYTQAAQGSKGHFGIAETSCVPVSSQAIPLAGVYLLEVGSGTSAEISQLRGQQSFVYWRQQAHRAWMGRRLGLQRQIFEQCAYLAQAVPLHSLKRTITFERLDETIDLLEMQHASFVASPLFA